MNLKTLLLSCMGVCVSLISGAQTNYNVTEAYLKNAGFDTHFDYAVGETGNVAQEIKDIYGWTKNISVNYTITGVYQIGTAKTFNHTPVPSKAHDGTTNGGVLALSTGWNQEMKYYQEVTLPAGTYTLSSAFYNGSDKTSGKSVVGWIPDKGSSVMSNLASFSTNTWIVDEVSFTLTASTKGKIQIGYGVSGGGSANHAKVCMDYIKLLRTTPLGSIDTDLKKEALAADIAAANEMLNGATGVPADVFRAVIEEAQVVHDNAATTIPDIFAAQEKLAEAVEIYSWAAPTGPVPTVTTNKRFARGGTMAFGRLTATGTGIVEKGFCWSTNPNPTINDERTTNFLNHNGAIYWIQGLRPSTKYYMRAYAITEGKQVGYGEIIKFYTIPQGQLGYTMRSGGDADARKRIDAAMKAAVGWWNNLTSIRGVNFNVGHNPGTPTADCSYGGYIRVGSNSSYQRTGTMLHEMAHGVGIGTHQPYWDGEMRSNGDRGLWNGDRVKEVIRFWENNENANITGDNMHFWPYGINGAHEDNGSDALYIIQSLIVQAFGEDGLPPSGGFASPAYSFVQEDHVKYYMKNESENFGLYSSYVVENEDGSVSLKEMSNEEAMANDHAAWNITFEPNTSFYAFKNVATGHYLTFKGAESNMGTADVATPYGSSLFHLMRSRVNAMESSDLRGYWMINNTYRPDPYAMAAKSNSGVGVAKYSLNNSAKDQRWLFVTKDEMAAMETVAKKSYLKELSDYLAQIKKLYTTPHTEDQAGTDEAFNSKIASLEARVATATTATEVGNILKEAKKAGFEFLANATPSNIAHPFDLTFMIQNPGMDNTAGWNGNPSLAYSSAEFYQTGFDFNQTIANMPAGCYKLMAQAFQRPGSAEAVYNDYVASADKVSTYLYLNSKAIKINNAVTDAQTSLVGSGNESALSSTPTTYIPNDMQSASAYFRKNLYDNEVVTNIAEDNSNLKIGIRCAKVDNMYWTIFDNFRLYYYGSMSTDVVSGINELIRVPSTVNDVYSIDGRLIRKGTGNLNGLPKGVYIIGGKKMLKVDRN